MDPRRACRRLSAKSRSAPSCPPGCCRSSPTPPSCVAYARTLPGLFAVGAGAQPQGRRARARRRRRPDARAAVGQPRAQPGQPAQDARRGGRRGRADPRRARRRRLATPASRAASAPPSAAPCRARSSRSEVLRLMQALLDAGADRVEPGRHRRLCRPGAGAPPVRAGAGDRRRAALAAATSTTRAAWRWPTCIAALEAGVNRFDASLAGIGGCPHAPGASRQRRHRRPGLHAGQHGRSPPASTCDALLALRADVAGWLDGEALHGRCGAPACRRHSPTPGRARGIRNVTQ